MSSDFSNCRAPPLQVAVRGEDTVVLAVEKRALANIQDARTVRKICHLDEHVALAFAGEYDNPSDPLLPAINPTSFTCVVSKPIAIEP